MTLELPMSKKKAWEICVGTMMQVLVFGKSELEEQGGRWMSRLVYGLSLERRNASASEILVGLECDCGCGCGCESGAGPESGLEEKVCRGGK